MALDKVDNSCLATDEPYTGLTNPLNNAKSTLVRLRTLIWHSCTVLNYVSVSVIGFCNYLQYIHDKMCSYVLLSLVITGSHQRCLQ